MSEHHHEKSHHNDEDHKHSSKATSRTYTLDLAKIMKPKVLAPIIVAIVIVAAFLWLLTKGWIVAATVNGAGISRHEVRNMVEKDAGADALRGLISQKLIDQEVKDKKIYITEEAIDEEITEISNLLETQGLTFAEAIKGQGFTMEDARKQIRRQLELEELLSEQIIVNEEEIEAFIKENEIPTPESAEEKDKLQGNVREQLKQDKLYNEYIILESRLRGESNIKFFVDYLDSVE